MHSKKNLSISAVLLAMLAGILGGVLGFGGGLALGGALAAAFHVSTMEGGAGYFAVLIALIVGVVSGPGAILLTLYWHGVRRIWLLIGWLSAAVGIVVIAAAGFWLWYMSQPHILNVNGPRPLLQFELKPPAGQSVEALANLEVELDTDRNVMPGYWYNDASNSGVRSGYVELYFRTRQRLLIFKSGNGDDRIFQLKLPANPMQPKFRDWSAWQKPDFVAKAGAQPSRPVASEDLQIRYKLDYQDR